MLSVKMQVKSGDGIVAARKTFAEVTQLLENVSEKSSKSVLMCKALKTKPQMRRKVHQVKEELFQELSKKNGKKENDELRNSQQNLTDKTQDLWRPRMRRLQKVVWQSPMIRVENSAYLVTPIRRGGPLEMMLQ